MLQRIVVIHGPNMNLLGSREPALYGQKTLAELNDTLVTQASQGGVDLSCFQSNAEYTLIDQIQNTEADFLVINAGGFSHTSIALRDALLAVGKPFIEVHISNTFAREEFRAKSYLSDIAQGVIIGLGTQGYTLAVTAAMNFLNNRD